MVRDDVGDLVAVGGDDDAIGHADLDDALPDANDQREAGEKAKRFSGETRGAQSSWDDGERPHTGRSWGCVSARTAAKITFSNVARAVEAAQTDGASAVERDPPGEKPMAAAPGRRETPT